MTQPKGKIPYIKKAAIDVMPKELTVMLDDVKLVGDSGHYEFVDNVDEVNHLLTFDSPVDEVWIENMSVTHLLNNNTLSFTTPIYRWLFLVLDNYKQ